MKITDFLEINDPVSFIPLTLEESGPSEMVRLTEKGKSDLDKARFMTNDTAVFLTEAVAQSAAITAGAFTKGFGYAPALIAARYLGYGVFKTFFSSKDNSTKNLAFEYISKVEEVENSPLKAGYVSSMAMLDLPDHLQNRHRSPTIGDEMILSLAEKWGAAGRNFEPSGASYIAGNLLYNLPVVIGLSAPVAGAVTAKMAGMSVGAQYAAKMAIMNNIAAGNEAVDRYRASRSVGFDVSESLETAFSSYAVNAAVGTATGVATGLAAAKTIPMVSTAINRMFPTEKAITTLAKSAGVATASIYDALDNGVAATVDAYFMGATTSGTLEQKEAIGIFDPATAGISAGIAGAFFPVALMGATGGFKGVRGATTSSELTEAITGIKVDRPKQTEPVEPIRQPVLEEPIILKEEIEEPIILKELSPKEKAERLKILSETDDLDVKKLYMYDDVWLNEKQRQFLKEFEEADGKAPKKWGETSVEETRIMFSAEDDDLGKIVEPFQSLSGKEATAYYVPIRNIDNYLPKLDAKTEEMITPIIGDVQLVRHRLMSEGTEKNQMNQLIYPALKTYQMILDETPVKDLYSHLESIDKNSFVLRDSVESILKSREITGNRNAEQAVSTMGSYLKRLVDGDYETASFNATEQKSIKYLPENMLGVTIRRGEEILQHKERIIEEKARIIQEQIAAKKAGKTERGKEISTQKIEKEIEKIVEDKKVDVVQNQPKAKKTKQQTAVEKTIAQAETLEDYSPAAKQTAKRVRDGIAKSKTIELLTSSKRPIERTLLEADELSIARKLESGQIIEFDIRNLQDIIDFFEQPGVEIRPYYNGLPLTRLRMFSEDTGLSVYNQKNSQILDVISQIYEDKPIEDIVKKLADLDIASFNPNPSAETILKLSPLFYNQSEGLVEAEEALMAGGAYLKRLLKSTNITETTVKAEAKKLDFLPAEMRALITKKGQELIEWKKINTDVTEKALKQIDEMIFKIKSSDQTNFKRNLMYLEEADKARLRSKLTEAIESMEKLPISPELEAKYFEALEMLYAIGG